MTDTSPAFDTELFSQERRKRGLLLGERLTAVARTGSTNDDASKAAELGAEEGSVFVADEQTRGRGRRGHAWVSPPGQNLIFSVLLRPSISVERASALSLVAGLAVRAAAARRVHQSVAIKWPNDVLVGNKKLAGTLVESRMRGADIEAVVIGIGVNVHMVDPPEEIASVATSLALLGDPAPSRETFLAEVLAELESRLKIFGADGLGGLLDELRRHDALLDARVQVGDVHGTAVGIDEQGNLLIRADDGKLHHVSSGTVERL